MNSSDKSSYPILTLDHSLRVEVYEPEFVPFLSTQFLDARELAKIDQRIEVGHMKGACCNQVVSADIEDGKVVGFEVEPCEDEIEELPMSEGLKELVSNVREQLESSSAGWAPMPVEEFVAMSKKRDPIKIGHGTTCVWICVLDWGCLICCKDRGCYTTPRGGNLLSP